MATLQVKNVPDELYVAAKSRAASEGTSLSEFILRMMQRELSRPSMSEWLAENAAARAKLPPIDTRSHLDAAKDEIETRYRSG